MAPSQTFGSFLQAPRRSGRLPGNEADRLESPACAKTVFARSQTVWESHASAPPGLGDYLAPSQTVCESPLGAQTVLAPSQTVWESSTLCPTGLGDCLAPWQTVCKSHAGAPQVWETL
ncbi:hypothetical protein DPMN_097232 [Dreissena polymorpha]|uniref:Uncharacterized protein n=1 Tax=Dreissena polymorpha TaxID=45954 RepID=A0A9D4R4J5_DREPO|nr:hypothetical protein DPMN_097232 [Dreissena polymorpha]